jgi:aldose 1-epimerase
MPNVVLDPTEIELEHGALKMAVCPALGGAITRLSFDGVDLLRPWDGTDNVRRTGCFVLAPFSNRVGEGAFTHEGQRYPLRSPSTEHLLPIHGVAWKRSWTVTEQGLNHLTLSVTHHPEGEAALDWPFAFEVQHRLTLGEHGVALRLDLRNIDDRSMPAGLGWHPYFLRHDGCQLQFRAQSVWQNDAANLPADLSQIPAQWDFAAMREIQEPGMDNCFVGRSGSVRLYWPESGIELEMNPDAALDRLVVFTPPSAMGFFAVEPVTHTSNALCMDDPVANGVCMLQPGESMRATCELAVGRLVR